MRTEMLIILQPSRPGGIPATEGMSVNAVLRNGMRVSINAMLMLIHCMSMGIDVVRMVRYRMNVIPRMRVRTSRRTLSHPTPGTDDEAVSKIGNVDRPCSIPIM